MSDTIDLKNLGEPEGEDWDIFDRSFLGFPRIEVYADLATPKEAAEWRMPAKRMPIGG